jgi:4-hydroxybutyrate CoA-transferase
MSWQDKYRDKLINAKQAAALVTSDSEVLFSMMNQPKDIITEIANRYKELSNVTLTSHWVDDFPFLHIKENPEMAKAFKIVDPMTLRHTREGVREKLIDWNPTVFGLSNGERQLNTDRGRLYHYKDFFFLRVTKPDDEGRCSFGPYQWYSPSAFRTAKVKIAEIDPNLPRVCGDCVSVDEIDYIVESPEENKKNKTEQIGWMPSAEEWEISQVIGANAASLIRDGDTLQIGVGTSAEAVLGFLEDKNDLGIDSEVIYKQLVNLTRNGNITGGNKSLDKGKVTSSCLQLYSKNDDDIEALEYVTDNPVFEFRDISKQCNVPRIASQNNMVAINNILGVDLLGQAVVTNIGPTPIGGMGGQLDYCVGSHYSKGGRSISMLKSTALDGKVTRIVPSFEQGTVIGLPMFYLDYLVTEYGVVNLDCKSRRERAEALISVAHPDFRPALMQAAKEMVYP